MWFRRGGGEKGGGTPFIKEEAGLSKAEPSKNAVLIDINKNGGRRRDSLRLVLSVEKKGGKTQGIRAASLDSHG